MGHNSYWNSSLLSGYGSVDLGVMKIMWLTLSGFIWAVCMIHPSGFHKEEDNKIQ